MVTKVFFCKTVSEILIFGHFFCPFLKFPKYFPQKIFNILSIILKSLKEKYNIFFNLKKIVIYKKNEMKRIKLLKNIFKLIKFIQHYNEVNK